MPLEDAAVTLSFEKNPGRPHPRKLRDDLIGLTLHTLPAMTIRRRTVEHVFGTLKHWMGYSHFLTRRLVNVAIEMRLHVRAHNLRQVISILGFAKMIGHAQAVRHARSNCVSTQPRSMMCVQ